MQPTSELRLGAPGDFSPSGTLFDSSVEIIRLTMKVVRGPRRLLQARAKCQVERATGEIKQHRTRETRRQREKCDRNSLWDPRRRRASKSTCACWTVYHRWSAPGEDHTEVQKEAPSSGQEGGDGREPCDRK